jgi:hypothetical protein
MVEVMRIMKDEVSSFTNVAFEKLMKEHNDKEKYDRENTIFHEGVKCSGCGEIPIKGIRYKCLISKDYDLCGDCEAKDMHPYPLAKIRRPE